MKYDSHWNIIIKRKVGLTIDDLVELHTPKKPKRKWDIANKKHYYICENCSPKGKNLIGTILNKSYLFCPKCGKKIDWNE